MRKILFVVLMVTIIAGTCLAEEARMLRYPDIHGDSIVFTYGGDLWIVSSQGGVARQLTTHPGMEMFPKFSPDGKHIAFVGDYDGNTDVFVIPSRGGEPKRLTYHPLSDVVVDWYPDGKHILFRSLRDSFRDRFNRYYKVSIEGGFPELQVLPEGELASFNSDASKIAYNRWGRENRTWKRYRGGMAPDVWVYDFENNAIENITNNPANDHWPMWIGDKIYFTSDRDEIKKVNLYAYDQNTKETTKLTDFKEYDVLWPGYCPNAIVFENGGWIYKMGLDGGAATKVPVEIYSDNILARPALKSVTGYIHSYEISPTGKRAVFEARGEIFTVPAKKGEIRNLTNTPGVRERSPIWSPDGKWLAYYSDKSGEFQIHIRQADGKGEEQQITKDFKTYMANLAWSPDSKKISFSDVTSTLYYVDIESMKVTRVFHNDYNGSSNFVSGSWSPDSKWITYAHGDPNMTTSVYLYNLENNEHHRITSSLYNDAQPAFEPDGKYLYWITNREYNFIIDQFEWNYAHVNSGKIVVATLAADTPSPFGPESDEEKVKEEKPEEEKKAEGEEKKEGEKTADKGKDDKAKEDKDIKIDIEGLGGRLINLPIPDGNYVGLVPLKDKVFFATVAAGSPGATLHQFDMKKRESKVIIGGVFGAAISFDGKKLLVRQGNNYAIVGVAPNQKTADSRLNLSGMQTMVDYRAEWKQVFDEAWRQGRDFFYDRGLHGQDWDKIYERYGQILPYIAHRDDLNFLIGEVIGELNSSHTYRGGGEYPSYARTGTGVLACNFTANDGGYFQISRIFEGENWNSRRRGPLSQPGLKVKEGDFLIAINGEEIKTSMNPYRYLVNTAGKVITLKINTEPKAEGAWDIEVQPVGNDLIHRQIGWIMDNIEKVNKATDGKVGYIYVPDTAQGGMEWFNRLFYSQFDKEALIVDARWNSGGFIPDIYLERLTRKLLNLWSVPYSKGMRWPPSAQFGPKVCLANVYSGSGGDAFPYYFQEHKLGPVIGTRTWGGLIGISGNPVLMDNGGISIADFAFVNADGEFDVENKGITPDIEIDNLPPEVIKGHDPQLEKGIEVIMDLLKNLTKPSVPELPKKFPIR